MTRTLLASLCTLAAAALITTSALVAGCTHCYGPPAEVTPATIEESTDAGPAELPDEGDTAMASEPAE